MTLSNARLGDRDVLKFSASSIQVRIDDEAVGGDWDVSEVAISLDFFVSRQIDPTTCNLSESVVAAYIFIPLNPPCGGGGMIPPQARHHMTTTECSPIPK